MRAGGEGSKLEGQLKMKNVKSLFYWKKKKKTTKIDNQWKLPACNILF